MPIDTSLAEPIYRSPREVLSALLHDLAQPISALECSTEVTLQKPRSPEDYVEALGQLREVSAQMRTRLEHFRALAGAVEACDCMLPVDVQSALAAAVEQVRPLAESLGMNIESSCEGVEVFGNRDKLVAGLVWALDYLITRGRSARLQLRVDQADCGELRLSSSGDQAAAASSDDALRVAQTAFATMGAEVGMGRHADEQVLELRLNSYRPAGARTSVIVGDF